MYSAMRRTLPAMKYATTSPTHAPNENHSSAMPVRYASPAPPNSEPEPIQVQTSVPTNRGTGTDRPATMKSAWLFTLRERHKLIPTRISG